MCPVCLLLGVVGRVTQMNGSHMVNTIVISFSLCAQGPKEVPGAARFMELREMARKKAEDEKRRQEEVRYLAANGMPQLCFVSCQGQSFTLSHQA